MLCPKCYSDDVDIIEFTKIRIWLCCYHCGKGSYIQRKVRRWHRKPREEKLKLVKAAGKE